MRRGKIPCGFNGMPTQLMTIETPTTPTDGETKPTWSVVAKNVPASRHFRVRASSEVVSGGRVLPQSIEEVSWLFRGDVDATCRLRFPTATGDEVLEILSVGNPDGARRWEVARCNRVLST